MNQYCLKFPDQSTAETELTAAGVEEIYRHGSGPGFEYYIVGQIVDVSNDEPPVITTHAGYHVNILGTLPSNLTSYETHPTTPRVVFWRD